MLCKTFILDTNVLLSDSQAIFSFDEHNIIIPLVVLEELDNHKSRPDEVGRMARTVARTLDDLRKQGNLQDGVKLPNGGTIFVMSIGKEVTDNIPNELARGKVDNAIIAFALDMKNKNPDCVLVSKDINVRIKCDALKIKTDNYLHMRITDTQEKLYQGVSRITLPVEDIDAFYEGAPVVLDENRAKNHFPNEILVFKDAQEQKSGIARFISPTQPLRRIDPPKEVFGLVPKNKEQNFAMDLLLDPNVSLVTLSGAAGNGKTILAVAAGLHQVLSPKAKYDKLIITRPVQPMGRDIGFLPGTIEEKMDPWLAPIKDNLNFLVGNRTGAGTKKIRSKKDGDTGNNTFKRDPYIETLFMDGTIEIEALTFIRGRSIPRAFIIVDEAQNLSIHELKTIVTRVGEGTKLIFTGDITQIDCPQLDIFTNGLTYVIEKFKEYPIAGHVTLIKGERSPLASLAAKVL